MIFECFKPTAMEGSDAQITVKIGCCNKRVVKKLSPGNSTSLLNLMQMNDEKFQYIMKKIDELKNNNSSSDIYLDATLSLSEDNDLPQKKINNFSSDN